MPSVVGRVCLLAFCSWAAAERVKLPPRSSRREALSVHLDASSFSVAVQNLAEFNAFYDEKDDWKATAAPAVRSLLSVKRGFREVFTKVKVWTEVAGLSFHMAIASMFQDKLAAGGRVLDIGCGTGALLAVFAELMPEGSVLEGLEYEREVGEKARQNMKRASQTFHMNDKGAASKVALGSSEQGIADGEIQGDAFKFNLDGKLNGAYDLVNVGFAMREKEVPATFWEALAVGGKLGLPLCDEPLQTSAEKCVAHYHIFTKVSAEANFPGASAEKGSAHETMNKEIKFIYVSTEVLVPVSHPVRQGLQLPRALADLFQQLLDRTWPEWSTAPGEALIIYSQDIYSAKGKATAFAPQDYNAASGEPGLRVDFTYDCEEGYHIETWDFVGLGEFARHNIPSISKNSRGGGC